MSKEIVVKSLAELPLAAKDLLSYCKKQKKFAFYGDLGVGKTTFIKHLCRELHSIDPVTSPTFALVNEYAGDPKIYHFDLYRLNAIEEALDIGMEEYLDQDAYCFIEWPQIVEPLLYDTVFVYMSLNEDNSRLITIEIG